MNTSTPATVTPSAEKRLYKSTMKFCNVVTSKGHILHFKGGFFATDNPAYIEFLDTEIAAGGFGTSIYIDPNARTMTAEQENPMLAMKNYFYEQFKREQAEQMDPNQDRGTSNQGTLKPASTSDIAAVVAGGDATARLVALSKAPAAPTK